MKHTTRIIDVSPMMQDRALAILTPG
jgi:hypothetical protein